MAAKGDNYNVREAQVVDGAGTVLGALFGGVLPTTVYIASVGAKEMRAGCGYSILNGLVFIVAATFGLIGAISKIIPLAVIAPILVFVGIVMVANAFISSPQHHAPAVSLAMIPYLANYLMSRFNAAAPEAVKNISPAVVPLGQGAMFTAMLWGALAVFLIDRQWSRAIIVALALAGLAVVGIIHAPKLMFMAEGAREFVYGYLIIAGICWFMHRVDQKATQKEEIGPALGD